MYEVRVLGEKATCVVSPEAAELFYDRSRFARAGALPGPVRRTLVGDGGVQVMDGAAHQHRKALFMSLVTPQRVTDLAARTARQWQWTTTGWPDRDEVVLFVAAAKVLTQASCDWAGIPLAAAKAGDLARDLVTMVDGFGSIGLRHWQARLARRHREVWLAELVEQLRRNELVAEADSPVAVVAGHRDFDGESLDPRTAAVELLNLLRPIAAVAWYVAFAAHALHVHPHWRDRLRHGEPAEVTWFAQEVRRFYPFAPAVGARVRENFSWHGTDFPRGRLVLLDVYATNHDPRRWPEPDQFDPLRFMERPIDPYELVPAVTSG